MSKKSLQSLFAQKSWASNGLFNVLAHGAYHRGKVEQVLKSISVAPPRDPYTKFLHVSEPARRQA